MPHATQHGDVSAVADAELDTALRGGPFHVALRAAIAARGLPLQRVQHHLSRYGVKVGVTSLSYWQQGARRPQRPESLRAVRALGSPGSLLPVAQAGDADLHTATGQVVLHALERQSPGGYRCTQGGMEGAASQGRVQFRGGDGGDVRVLCGVRHAGAFLWLFHNGWSDRSRD